ncbi:plasmid partitioning protein RepB [Oceaniglobus roseus]|uniref:plasmid partitioning protein RepB n=1 Tax=Oceaniglobus roseus TaxID=1737570 RepID=UPI000C7EAFB6|nr:plasmid partitioning protein RepB [Kandeliimicrobium roseum]
MTSGKKKRMSILDGLAAAGGPAPASGAAPMMTSNRALRSARDAVDAHHVWELDPDTIEDGRLADRLDPSDVADLREAIEVNGQAVPILVRRHPSVEGRYLLVYGRRRLEAIRLSDKVAKVRALVATLDDGAALQTQISENMARRDLSFIEKALFAQELVESGFGTQNRVAEVLTVTKSSVSMAIKVAEAIGRDLAQAIGPAPGIGRPRWEALAQAMAEAKPDPARLIAVAEDVHAKARDAYVLHGTESEPGEVSVAAFEAVLKAVGQAAPRPAPARRPKRRLTVGGAPGGVLRRSGKGIALELDEGPFADWVEARAQDLIEDLHARWLKQAED